MKLVCHLEHMVMHVIVMDERVKHVMVGIFFETYSSRIVLIELGLSCSASTTTCQCSSTQYWNGSSCIALLYPGQTCSSTSQCINNSACVSLICQCNTNYYYSTLAGICTSQLSFTSACTLGNYQCLNNTGCYDLTTSSTGTCSCDLTYYYYDGTRCTLYATYGQSCAATAFGPFCNTVSSALICSAGVCTCPSTTYYNNSACVAYTNVGFPCTSSSQCETNSNCSSGVCTCLSSYYFDTTTGNCLALLSYAQTCTSSIQCSTNMICTSSQCLCTATTYYVAPNCITRVSYGGACTGPICDTTLGLQCISSICQCNATQYLSTLTNGTQVCANLRTLGQSCTANSDCQNSATSVKCVTNICECDYSAYYLDRTTVTCDPLKANGVACSFHYECASTSCNASTGCSTAPTIISNVTQVSSIGSVGYPLTTFLQFLVSVAIFLLFV